ncbi:hypothetical protein DOT_3005 [Desulfosporosinus sp. OT]|nr:hypothetical protein DOT_3005 [Desulfosporosinus sp. OT]
MLREECYYLIKLSTVSDVESPSCDPATTFIDDSLSKEIAERISGCC